MGIVSGALGAAAIGGALLSSNSANKNARRAAQTSENNNAANIALQRESRDMALQRLDPFTNRGNAAGGAINALLGLGGSQEMGGPATVDFAAYAQANPDVLAEFGRVRGQFNNDLGEFGRFHYDTYGRGEGRQLPGMTPNAPTTAQGAQQAQEDAFARFRNSTGYQFRVNEGMDALNSGFAGSGLLQSGAALRSLDDYRQGMASAEFGNYLNALSNQQAVGAGAASAGAGVSQNFAAMATNSNNLNAQNQMNAQLGRQNPLANALGTVGGLGFGFLTGGR